MGTPGFGVLGGGYLAGEWSVSTAGATRSRIGIRRFEYQRRGRNRQSGHQRSRVADRASSIRRPLGQLNLGIPYFMGTRSQQLRVNGVNLGRFQTQARGVGDAFIAARRWIFDPDTHPGGNLQLGFGFKIPTGANNVTDTFRVNTAGVISSQIRTVDQSIQPGDGGFGILVDFSTFKSLTASGFAVWGGGAYLSTPGEKSEVLTYRGGAGEEIMSIADQYLLRGGAAMPIPMTKGHMQFSAGLRVEGVPVRDVIGGDTGFRRPGVAVSFEPAININVGTKNQLNFGVPVALYRNRFISVPDEARGAHGDAAFADYLVLAGFTRKF